ncbi:MAG: glutathione S-transferase family protein [Hoeflea sp.]|uniref:glutathione S-transferase family protein n=1 Tax=Hoeflea sp. TaxID=1940281 RepID=UPI003EF6134D
MITLHALEFSRATRVLWLLENLGQPCERIDYERKAKFRAPEALSHVHPLGKSPVIEDNGEMIAESSTILRYLVTKYGDHSHRPPKGTEAFWRHEALFDYVEASLAGGAMQAIMPAFQGKDVPQEAKTGLNKHLSYLERELAEGPFLFGAELTLADIQVSYILALLAKFELLNNHPKIVAYWEALQSHPGLIAATRAAGPMAPPN